MQVAARTFARMVAIAALISVASGACWCGQAQTDAAPADAPARTASGITFFRSDVTMKEDTSLEVREEIVVNDAASFYKYGFRRDLPITPQERWDVRYVGVYKPDNGVRVKIQKVTEDGAPVRYSQGNGYGYSQITIGEPDVPLDSGEHRFELRYTVTGATKLNWQNDANGSRDLLYWNSIGHERNVPVAEAVLAIYLPASVPAATVGAEAHVSGRGLSYPQGSETTLDKIGDAPDVIEYGATNVKPRQSLSLAVTWPSGYVHPQPLEFLGPDKWLFAAPSALFLFYLIAWICVGREPKAGTVVVKYEPPDGLSAAGCRWVAYGKTDGRSFAAVIGALAVHKCVSVEPANGKYRLSRLMSDPATESALAPEEKVVLSLLFTDGPTIELSPSMDQINQGKNSLYINAIHNELKDALGGKYLSRHMGFVLLGILATVAICVPLALTAKGRDTSGALFFTIWVLFVGLMLGMMMEMTFLSAWKSSVRSGMSFVRILPGTAAIAIFGTAIGYLLKQLAAGVSLSFAAMIVAFLAVNLGWAPFLKRTSALGRQTKDHIAGFRQFLEKVEQDRLNRMNTAAETPEELDQFLPYAIALEVKEAWGDHLTQTFLASAVMVEE